MNPATALATVLVDELARCGLAEAVIAPGSRSAPLALALWQQAENGAGPAEKGPGPAPRGAAGGTPPGPAPRGAAGGPPPGPALRLHVRIDERSAAFVALGLAKASGRPVVVACTSGTAAAHIHAAVIEADQAGVPLLVLTADRPPELRGTGANQAIDQIKLYGDAVRWFCEVGPPEARAGMNAYWRSLACRAWAAASGEAGGQPGPVHLNLPLREPLVPGAPGPGAAETGWPEELAGRPGGARWTTFRTASPDPRTASPEPAWLWQSGSSMGMVVASTPFPALELPWTERGVVICGDGCSDPGALVRLAEQAGWPVLAEPSSGARTGPAALAAYPYLLDSPEFVAAHKPDVIVSAGRPGLSRAQLGYLRAASPSGGPPRHVVIAQGPGRWADPARTATDVAPSVRLVAAGHRPAGAAAWLASWQAADAAAAAAASAILGSGDTVSEDTVSEPRLARDLAAALPDGALLWAASSLPIRDLDQQMTPRAGVRVLANRGTSGIDGLVSAAIGAALAHQRAGGGPAVALLGDLAFLHDAPGLFAGPGEPRPDLLLVVVSNDGGGIFSLLEQAALAGPFERVFGTPHGGALCQLAVAAGIPAIALDRASDLAAVLAGEGAPAPGPGAAPGQRLPSTGIRMVEVRTSRAAGAVLRDRLRAACTAAAARAGSA